MNDDAPLLSLVMKGFIIELFSIRDDRKKQPLDSVVKKSINPGSELSADLATVGQRTDEIDDQLRAGCGG